MTERGTKTLIGVFVLGALALAVVFVMLVGSGAFASKKTTSFVLYFDASLRGLVQGSPVYFKGVRVGRVTSIQIMSDGSSQAFAAPVIIELDNSALTSESAGGDAADSELSSNEHIVQDLIRRGLRAKLGMQSFVTGQLTVDLDMFPDNAPVDPMSLKRYRGLQQIPSIPSSLDAMLDVVNRLPLEEISAQTLAILDQVNSQVSGIDLPALSDSITQTSEAVRTEVQAFAEVRAEAVNVLANLSALTNNANTQLSLSAGEFNATLRSADKTLADISSLSQSSRRAADGAAGLLREDSAMMLELSQTLRALREASAAISQLATLLELKPDALIFGRDKR